MSQEISYAPNTASLYVPATLSTSSVAASQSAAVSSAALRNNPAALFELKTTNLYTGEPGNGSSSNTSQTASEVAAAAGLPYVPPNVVTQLYNQTKTDPAMEQLKQQMLFFAQLNAASLGASSNAGNPSGGNPSGGIPPGGIPPGGNPSGGIPPGGSPPGGSQNNPGSPWGPANFTAGAGPLAYNSPIPTLSESARAAVNATGQNVWALVVVALKGAMEDQNATLQYDLNKLKMYGTMSDQMSSYAQVLEQTQTNLDAAIQNQTDENKKGNQEVEMPTQLSFGPSSMFTLDANGDMLPQVVSKSENAKNNANPVSAQGLNAKLTIFQQQRDQLQKNIDHWTNQYQSDNEVKNQLTTTITSILKNMYDMQGAVTRNINL